jgi:hypothetical protein
MLPQHLFASDGVHPTPLTNLLSLPQKVLFRYLSKIKKQREGCWEWTGALNPEGYGILTYVAISPYPIRAHRLSYELSVGPIPDNMHVHHVCENRRCVNPAHLMAVDAREHIVNLTPGSASYKASRVTHCPHGHEYTPENTWVVNGKRDCRECNRINCTERYRKWREANPIEEQTHCKNGHPLSGDNLYLFTSNGYQVRGCKLCRHEATRRWRREQAAQRPPTQPKPERTHCLKGHELTPDNVMLKRNSKCCRICARLAERKRYWAAHPS